MDGDAPAKQAEKPKGWRAHLEKVLAEVRAQSAAAEMADSAEADTLGADTLEADPVAADQVEADQVEADPAAGGASARSARSLRSGPRLPSAGDKHAAAGDVTNEAGPIPSAPAKRKRAGPVANRALADRLNSRYHTSRPKVSPHLRNDPRLRVWTTRAIVALAIVAGFTIGVNWRIGLTAAVVYIAADSILRSKTTSVVPSGVRVTSAQRLTRHRLRVLQPAGYVALHARSIPGTKHVIDHVVVGPAGVFTLDSQRLDRRMPIRVIGGMLFHGRTSMEPRLDHAKHEAQHAATLIAAELGKRARVLPAMALYGPNISWVVMKVKGVDVFDGSRIGTYFRGQTKAVGEKRLDASQIAMVLAAAARALPPLH